MTHELKQGAAEDFGKLIDEDEEELRMSIGIYPKTSKVIVNFGKPVAWIGMEARDALQFALFIRKRALEAGMDKDILRTSGDVVCEECGDIYYHHPNDMNQLYEGRPFLRVACDGRRLKL
jgi:hypothetical protein